MAKFTGSRGKLTRRFGENIFDSPKFDKVLQRRNYKSGQHGPGFKRKDTDYGIHLKEKQKLRYTYGVLERQFKNYFEKADKMSGITGENLLQMLEARLDNVVFRMGFARTRPQARQLVNHGHVVVNGRKVDIPSYQVKPGDKVEIKEKSRTLSAIIDAIDSRSGAATYPWIEVDIEKFAGEFKALPKREEIPVNIDDRLIIEFYSK